MAGSGKNSIRSTEEEDLVRRSTEKIQSGPQSFAEGSSGPVSDEDISEEVGAFEGKATQSLKSYKESLRVVNRMEPDGSENNSEDNWEEGMMQSRDGSRAKSGDEEEENQSKKGAEFQIIEHSDGKHEWPEFVLGRTVEQRIQRPWKSAFIVKLLGRRVGFKALETRLQQLWALHGVLTIIHVGNDFFVVKFTDSSDLNHVLTGGPWLIYDGYLTVRKWCPNFDPFDTQIKSVAWITFPDLPIEYYDEEVLKFIGNRIGKTVKVDYATAPKYRGRYARMCVEVDLSKPLLAKFQLKGRSFKIEYEGLLLLCFSCGRFGHYVDGCPEKRTAKPVDRDGSGQGSEFGQTRDSSRGTSYDPWTVEQKSRNGKKTREKLGSEDRGNLRGGNGYVGTTGLAGSGFQSLQQTAEGEELAENAGGDEGVHSGGQRQVGTRSGEGRGSVSGRNQWKETFALAYEAETTTNGNGKNPTGVGRAPITAPVSSSNLQPVSVTSQSASTFETIVPLKEHNAAPLSFRSSYENVDKIKTPRPAFSSSSLTSQSSAQNSGVPSETKADNSNSLANVAPGAFDTVAKIPESDKGDNKYSQKSGNVIGRSDTSISATASNTAPIVFGSSASASSSSFFSFTSAAAAAAAATATATAASASCQTQPIFGSSPPAFDATSGNGDVMNMEDSKAKDPVQASPPPAAPVFGQTPIFSPASSSVFGSTPSAVPSSLIVWGRPDTSISATARNTAPIVFGSSASASSSSFFSFTSAAAAATATATAAAASCQTQPIFGSSPHAFDATSGNGDVMNMEDSKAKDPVQASQPPAAPVVGQTPIFSPASSSVFGSTSSAVPSSQFGGQQNQSMPQNPSPFQASSSLEFNAGGNFSLGSTGGDKSNQKILRVKRTNRRK